MRTLAQLFDRFVSPEPMSGCWLWTGKWNADGYGVVVINYKHLLAHRVVYALHVGGFAEEKRVLHRCDVPCCVNPDHLFLGTQADNIRDMENKKRSYHPRGSAHGRAKLSESDVVFIRNSPDSNRVNATKFGVSSQVISQLRQRKIWKHVP